MSIAGTSTVSVVAADEEGGGVAASFSAGYGSGVIPGGTGMLMNNALGDPGLDLSDAPYPLRPFDTAHMYFGGVNGAGLMVGKLVAHADGRRTGSVAFTTP